MRANTNIQTKQQRQLHLSDFRGVDFFSSPLKVEANRAADMQNFIHENGKSKKRNGWEQVIKRIPGRINMIYPYQWNGEPELLVYAGTLFYRITKAKERTVSDYILEKITAWDAVTYKDQRCQAFEHNGVIYIVGCGNLLQYVRGDQTHPYELKAVPEYVPTTTIDINAEGSEVVREMLQQPNLLTRKRKNKLVGGAADSVWRLDSDVNFRTLVSIEYVEEKKTDENNVSRETITFTNNGSGVVIYKGNDPVGSITELGELKLNINTTPLDIGTRNNLTVTFTADTTDKKSQVTNCNFGVLFGVGGAADRLFLSGNPAYKNAVWFSEADNFAYFPDQNTAVFGTDQQAITSFARLNDQTLAVFKEPRTGEPSVYYQSGEYRTTYDENGDVDKITPVFSITAGASNESALNPYCVANLEGDNLILSKNGVFGIELQENVQINARIAKHRSLAITPKLEKHESLADAAAIVYKGKYYLGVDGVCYIADSLYRYNSKDSRSMQYEWWYWNNLPARSWAEVDGELWFGTDDGRICRFTNEYEDRTFELGERGDFTIDYENNCIVYADGKFFPQVDDVVNIRTDGVLSYFFGPDPGYRYADDNTFYSTYLDYEDLLYYQDKHIRVISEMKTSKVYHVEDVRQSYGDAYKATFCLVDEEGEILTDWNSGNHLLAELSWQDLYVSRVLEITDEGGTRHGITLKISKESTKELKYSESYIRADARFFVDPETNTIVYSNFQEGDVLPIPGDEIKITHGALYQTTDFGENMIQNKDFYHTDKVMWTVLHADAEKVIGKDICLVDDQNNVIPCEFVDIVEGEYAEGSDYPEYVELNIKKKGSTELLNDLFSQTNQKPNPEVAVRIESDKFYVGDIYSFTDSEGQERRRFAVKLSADDVEPIDLSIASSNQSEFPLEIEMGSVDVATNIIVYVSHATPVVCRWLTPVFDMGNCDTSKTLYKLTIAADNESYGRVRFGCQTRFKSEELAIRNARPFNFDLMNFESFTFEPIFWASYSVKVKVPRFNYIRFWFESNEPENCSINDFIATYAIITRNLGVK